MADSSELILSLIPTWFHINDEFGTHQIGQLKFGIMHEKLHTRLIENLHLYGHTNHRFSVWYISIWGFTNFLTNQN